MDLLIDTLGQARGLVDAAIGMATARATTRVSVRAGATLQTIIDMVPAGSTLALEPASYPGTLVLSKSIRLEPLNPVADGRAPATGVMIVGTEQGLVVTGDDVSLHGLTVSTGNNQRNLVEVTGARFVADQCAVLGSPTHGGHRGYMLNGNRATISRGIVDHMWLSGKETQAIIGWDGSRDIIIDDCLLRAASQSVMFGGADSTTPDRIPTNIAITNCDLTKDLDWGQRGGLLKNALEFKAVVGAYVADCRLEGAGIAEGQGAYLIVLKSANQGGKAPWSTVQSVLVEHCVGAYAGGCVSFVGRDGTNALPMNNVTIRDMLFRDIDPSRFGGPGRAFTFSSAPSFVTLQGISVEAKNMAAAMYFNNPPMVGLTLREIVLPLSTYGVKIDGGGPGAKTPEAVKAQVTAWAPGSVVEDVTFAVA